MSTPPATTGAPGQAGVAGLAWRGVAWFGPAFVAAIAYVDPGGRDLAELCRIHHRPAVVYFLWAQAEIVAMATDVAEIVGGAMALRMLFGMPLPLGGVVTAVVAFGLLGLHARGLRPFEIVVTGLLLVVFAGIVYDAVRVRMDPAEAVRGLAPTLPEGSTLVLANGILGATVMPHVVYLHSALTARFGRRPVDRANRSRYLALQRADILVALGIAGLVNMAMLATGAGLLHGWGDGTRFFALSAVRDGLRERIDAPAATAFALALLAAGFASSGVGTLAGQVVIQGFLRRRIPLPVRRAATMLPALVVLGADTDLTHALVLSQVVLSFGIPVALIRLVMLTRRAEVMGDFVNRPSTTAAAWAVSAVIIVLNVTLVVDALSP